MADVENAPTPPAPDVGVPGSDPVHKEGTEYVKQQVEQKQEGQQGEGTVSNTKPDPISPPQPPASNPSAHDPSGGIGQGAGGVSASAHVESPVTASGEEKGIVDTVKSFLGFDSRKEKEAADARNADGTIVGGLSAAVFGASGGLVVGQTADLVDRTRTSAPVSSSEDSTAMASRTSADSGAAAASSSSPATTDTANQKDDSTDNKATENSNENPEQKKSGGGPKSLENRNAIPTAGGEKLGEKHWGESQIVPDVPKPKESDSGVASSQGQPTDEVANNTAKNTGGATGGPGDTSEDKEKKGLADKIKDKLPFGKKE